MPKQKREIFTSLTNETRYVTGVKIDEYKRLLDRKDAHRRRARPKYMRENMIHAAVFNEIKGIVDDVLTSEHNPTLSKSFVSRSESSLPTFVSRSESSLPSHSPTRYLNRQGSTSSVSSTHYKSIELPPINERYGNDLVSKWHRGGCAIVKGIKTPYVSASNETFRDPQARKLHRQTEGLLDGMKQMSRHARFYANYRRSIMDKTMNQGKDHVVESLENFMPQEGEDNSETIVESVFAKLSFVKRMPRRKIASRIDELWAALQLPIVSKLNLKLHCDENAAQNEYIEVLNALEELCDLSFAVNMTAQLRYAWAENKLPDIYSKKHVISSIEAHFKGTRLKHYSKKSWEDMSAWFNRLLDDSWERLSEDFDICKGYCAHHSDFALLEHLSKLQQELRDMVEIKFVPPTPQLPEEQNLMDIVHTAAQEALSKIKSPTPKKAIRGVLVEDEATDHIVDITQLKKYYNKKSKNIAPYQQFRESLMRSHSSFVENEQPS